MVSISILGDVMHTNLPLDPLDVILATTYQYVGDFIQIGEEYCLAFDIIFGQNLPTGTPSRLLYYEPTGISPLIIRSTDELNNFITIEYKNTLFQINSYWDRLEDSILEGEPTFGPDKFHIHSLHVALYKY